MSGLAEELGDRLKRLMKAEGHTPTTLARKARVGPTGPQRIRDVIAGRSKDPGVYFMDALADALGVSLKHLIHGEAQAPSTTAELREDIVERTMLWAGMIHEIETRNKPPQDEGSSA